jgi:hypothetical protein
LNNDTPTTPPADETPATVQFSQAMRKGCLLFGSQQASEWFARHQRGGTPSISLPMTQPELAGVIGGAVLAQIAPITAEIAKVGQKLAKRTAELEVANEKIRVLLAQRKNLSEALEEIVTKANAGDDVVEVAATAVVALAEFRSQGAAANQG